MSPRTHSYLIAKLIGREEITDQVTEGLKLSDKGIELYPEGREESMKDLGEGMICFSF